MRKNKVIEKYWKDLNFLTGDHLDIYFSDEDLKARVSGYETITKFRSLKVRETELPALILWKENLENAVAISIGNLPHNSIMDVMKHIVQHIAEGEELHQVQTVAIDYIDSLKELQRPSQLCILYLTANPNQTSRLDLEEELRAVEAELRSVKYREQVRLVARHAVRPDDLIRYVREDKPAVIHFSGHGSDSGIILRTDDGGFQPVSGTALKQFLAGRGVDLVVLNACFSESQGSQLHEVVEAVVGTTGEVDDMAARRFAVAFYRAIGNGLTIWDAYRDGRDAGVLHGFDDTLSKHGSLDKVLLSPYIS